jgi:hypothetical protein
MESDQFVQFKCPEGHVIEVRPDQIKGNAQKCEKCGKEYKFRKVELERES